MSYRYDPHTDDAPRGGETGRGLAYRAVRDTWLVIRAVLLAATLALGLLAAVLGALLRAKPRR